MSGFIELERKLSRKLETGKGCQLSGEELALMASLGVFEIVQAQAAIELRELCQKRSAVAGFWQIFGVFALPAGQFSPRFACLFDRFCHSFATPLHRRRG